VADYGITRNQKRVIAALLTCKSVQQAADQTCVGHRTISRWLAEDAAFQAALAQAEGRAIDVAARYLVTLAGPAIATLARLLANNETTDAVKLRAAQAVLDHLLKLRELRNVEQRLAKLEATINDAN